MSTRLETTTREIVQDRSERRPSYDNNMRMVQILLQYRDSTDRSIEIRRSHLDEATHHHHTFIYQLYMTSDNQEREEAHTGDIYDDSIATRQQRRTCLYGRFPFLDENSREEDSGGERQLEH